MNIFRNKQFSGVFIIISIIILAAVVTTAFFSIIASVVILVAGFLILLVLAIDARKRFNAMEQLSTELDEILHDNSRFLITEFLPENSAAILTGKISPIRSGW